MPDLTNLLNLLLLAVGFGFVIFWHELGHFLAAKWAGVRVEQFAVGFGNAAVSYRKGLGLRRGTSGPEYQRRIEADPRAALSPTEYRLNWLPLGGYVKMLGQEDLAVTDKQHLPESYQAKTVGQRMVIISAGVVMNVILAAVLFTLVYMWGFSANAPAVGATLTGTPAAQAGLEVGDRVVSVNGRDAHDFGKLRLGIALADPRTPTTLVIQPAGTTDPAARQTRTLSPVPGDEAGGMLTIGVLPMPTLDLTAVPATLAGDLGRLRETTAREVLAVLPGERVAAVDNTEVLPGDYPVYARALTRAAQEGRPVVLDVLEPGGTRRMERVMPEALPAADGTPPFAGLIPLLRVERIPPDSPLSPGGERERLGLSHLRPGDVLLAVTLGDTGDTLKRPDRRQLGGWLDRAGRRGGTVTLTVERDGQPVTLSDLPLTSLGGGLVSRMTGRDRRGLGVLLTSHLADARVAGLDAQAADVRVTHVAGEAVSDFYGVSRALAATPADDDVHEVAVTFDADGQTREATLAVTDAQRLAATDVRWVGPVAAIRPDTGVPIEVVRRTANPVQAVWWGVLETRDQIANLYVTLRRVTVDRTVAASNLSGPVGILHFGTIVAAKGPDWLVWFLAMLSANLAVVNFLPIPILDGGHMVFLLWEKIRGRAPPRAVQEGALWLGLAILGCFVVFVTINDIGRLIPF